jgi:hypothetical protein
VLQGAPRWSGCVLILLLTGIAACGGSDLIAPVTDGTLEVVTATGGTELDPDGYTVSLDGGQPAPIGITATLSLPHISAGSHSIAITGLTSNCAVQGDNPRQVTVAAGGSARADFTVVCSARVGVLEVSTTSSGSLPDPDGYVVSVDEGAATHIAVKGRFAFGDVSPGSHQVSLAGLAANCSVQGPNPQQVSVIAGATTNVVFAILCPAATDGMLAITTSTTGAAPDLDGYTISIDGGDAMLIDINRTSSLALPAGTHQVLLAGLASNCVVQNANPQQVDVTSEGSAEISFIVACPRPTGSAWRSVPSGTTKSLLYVSGSSANNVFIAGAGTVCHDGDCGGEMTILHYGGADWSTQYAHTGGVLGLWAAPTGEAFALAEGGTFPAPILYYDGNRWDLMAVQPPQPRPTLHVLWGSSATDVFAAGDAGFVVHYDGIQWSRMTVDLPDAFLINDVWGSSASDVFALAVNDGSETAPGIGTIILHYDGHAWTEVLRLSGARLSFIWGTSARDVYASGSSGPAGVVYHFDGTRWSPLPSPATPELREIWASGPTDVYALGQTGNVWHYDGNAWIEIRTNASAALGDIWGSSARNIVAVGLNGTILHGP